MEDAPAAAAKLLQSCPTLCDLIDSSSPIPGVLQARTLEWVAISFSNAWKWKVKVKSLSRVRLLATPWTAAHQAPPFMGFSRQEYWSGVPLPSLGRCTILLKTKAINHRRITYQSSINGHRTFFTITIFFREIAWIFSLRTFLHNWKFRADCKNVYSRLCLCD